VEAPHRLGPLRVGRGRLVDLGFQLTKPLGKAGMELLAQSIPLFPCTALLERDHLSCSQRCLLVWQDDVMLSC